jgi:hypothetical protein
VIFEASLALAAGFWQSSQCASVHCRFCAEVHMSVAGMQQIRSGVLPLRCIDD